MPREHRRFAVLGSPIAHSKSPDLHAAASRVLGLDWSYGRQEIDQAGLADFVDGLDASWRGLSLTMPLKETVLPLLTDVDPLVELTGAANTVVFDGERRLGFNTDVQGIVAAFRERGIPSVERGLLLGTGATARSTVVALQRLGVHSLVVSGRTAARAEEVAELARSLGVRADVHRLGDQWPHDSFDVIASTLPGSTEIDLPILAHTGVLFDVAYGPEPSAASRLIPAEAIVDGLDMLIHQALLQVRAFLTGDPTRALPQEAEVLQAMKAAVGGF
ncbi:shikimate dehydrogenase family protein [Naasia lichenicola]|uniref:shikimate dehydrogenase family protein n=1 Tax=Naasia lichenicola TaxID=2565933 RepID=UPI00130E81D9|nr:shikimate dehydrogenase [Naasia lichenicola]